MTNSIPPNYQQTVTRLQQADQIVEVLAKGQQRSNRLTLACGVFSLLAVSGYFYFVYHRLEEHLQPEAVVEIAQNMLEERWPDAREALEKHVQTSAPEWAAQLSQQTLDGIPQARAYLQDYALRRMDELAVETISLSDERFREYVRKQRPLFRATFQDLAKSPAGATAHLTDLRILFENDLDSDFQVQMTQLLQAAVDMNMKLATLRAGQNLTPEQQLERRVLMLARRLQDDHLSTAVATSVDQ